MLNLIAALVVSASLMPPGKQMYLDSAGNPLSGGKVYTYAAGTSTPLATYSDQAGTVPNANPVVLNSRGEASIFWGAGPYKVTLTTSAGALLWTQDNLYPAITAGEALGGPLKLYSGGNAGAPELTWADDTNSGFVLLGSDNVGLSLGGTKRWDYAAAGSTLTGTLTVSGATTLQSTLAVTGASTFSDAASFLSSTTTSGIARFPGGISGATMFNDAVSFAGSVTVSLAPTADTDAANKAYVTSAIAGTYSQGALVLDPYGVGTSTCADYTVAIEGIDSTWVCSVSLASPSPPATLFAVARRPASNTLKWRFCNLSTTDAVGGLGVSQAIDYRCFKP